MSTPDDPFAPPTGDQPGPPAGGPPPSGPPSSGPPPWEPPPGQGSPPGYPPPPGYGPPPGYSGPPGYGPPPGYTGGPGYGAPPGWGQQQPWQPGPATSTKAVVALVLAIASFMVCPLIPAVIALVIASQAKQEIAYSGGRVGGDGLVTAARVIAWINIGLAVAGLGLLALLIGVGTSTSP